MRGLTLSGSANRLVRLASLPMEQLGGRLLGHGPHLLLVAQGAPAMFVADRLQSDCCADSVMTCENGYVVLPLV